MTESVVMGMASAIFLFATGVALFFAGRACENGSIARNNAIGIRTRYTLSSDEAWEVGHVAGGRNIKIAGFGILAGSAIAVLTGLLVFLGMSENVTNSVIAMLIITSAIWALVWVLLAAAKANAAVKALST